MRARLLWLRSCLGALLGAGSILAHDPGLSSSLVTLEADAIVVTVDFDAADVAGLTATDDAALLAFARRAVHIAVGDTRAELQEGTVGPSDAGDNDYVWRLRFTRPAGAAATFELRACADLPRGHRHYVSVVDERGRMRGEALLHAKRTALSLDLGDATGPSAIDSGLRFIGLGWEHILIGYDHLLFLIVLLLGARSLRSAAAIITAFTVAHSLTLALASLDVVRLPGALVESVIALSIVYVAIENLVRGDPRHRWRITFVFGLVHGFGFASVLRDLGIADAGGIAVPLLSFNVGVELGQLAVAALAWPLLLLLRRRPGLRARALPALSCGVALLAAWWFLERAVLGA